MLVLAITLAAVVVSYLVLKPKQSKQASSPPPKEPTVVASFMALVKQALAADPRFTSVAPGDDEWTLRVKVGEREVVSYWGNHFADWRGLAPVEKAERLRFAIEMLAQTDEDLDVSKESWEAIAPRLRICLRVATFGLQAPNPPPKELSISRPFAGGVHAFLAIDLPGRIMYVNESQLAEWNKTKDEVLAAGIRGLGASSLVPPELFDKKRGIFTIDDDEGYAASYLALPGFLDGFQDKVRGRPIAIIPDRSTLMIAGDEDDETVRLLAERGKRDFENAARPLSPALFTSEDGMIVPYRRQTADALCAFISGVQAAHVKLEHDVQNELIERAHPEGEMFAATLGTITLQHRCVTWCTWPVELPTWLPVTDLVALSFGETPSGKELVLVPWADVRAVMGDVLQPVPLARLPRVHPTRPPTAEEVASLRAKRLDLEALKERREAAAAP